jgi:CoA:oxalate CoA-transferase
MQAAKAAHSSPSTAGSAACAAADVVIENFRPGAAARLGLDATAVRARNSRVVYCSITRFGRREPRERSGYDFIVRPRAG